MLSEAGVEQIPDVGRLFNQDPPCGTAAPKIKEQRAGARMACPRAARRENNKKWDAMMDAADLQDYPLSAKNRIEAVKLIDKTIMKKAGGLRKYIKDTLHQPPSGDPCAATSCPR